MLYITDRIFMELSAAYVRFSASFYNFSAAAVTSFGSFSNYSAVI